jgi:hypothetical protein
LFNEKERDPATSRYAPGAIPVWSSLILCPLNIFFLIISPSHDITHPSDYHESLAAAFRLMVFAACISAAIGYGFLST